MFSFILALLWLFRMKHIIMKVSEKHHQSTWFGLLGGGATSRPVTIIARIAPKFIVIINIIVVLMCNGSMRTQHHQPNSEPSCENIKTLQHICWECAAFVFTLWG